MCIDGVGFKGIAEELNRRAVISPKGRLWAFTTIKAMLENPVYRGDIVWNQRTESKFYCVREGRADERRSRVTRPSRSRSALQSRSRLSPGLLS